MLMNRIFLTGDEVRPEMDSGFSLYLIAFNCMGRPIAIQAIIIIRAKIVGEYDFLIRIIRNPDIAMIVIMSSAFNIFILRELYLIWY